MTDYTKRLDEILSRLENSVERDVVLRSVGNGQRLGRSPKSIHAETITKLTLLFREMIKEAKPEVPIIADYFALDSYRNAIDQYESNLLKMIGEKE